MSSRGMFRTATVLAFVVSFAATSCLRENVTRTDGISKFAGTDVGNPKRPTKAAITILKAVCDKLARCLGVSPEVCTKGVPTVEGLVPALSLPVADYGQYSNLMVAEDVGSIRAGTVAPSCGEQIQALSCDDPRVRNAYVNLPMTNPFQNVASMIPQAGACPVVFGSSLRVTPWVSTLSAGSSVMLRVDGGVEPYTFTLETAGVGGSVNNLGKAAATYQAPPPGAGVGTASILVTDSAGRSVRALITVVAKSASELRTGGDSTCALVHGEVQCWGRNDRGQLGDGTLTNRWSPVVQSRQTSPASFTLSMNSGCSVVPLGVTGQTYVACWGAGTEGQLGNGSNEDRPIADFIPASYLSGVSKISSGSSASTICAIDAGGSLYCWGANESGQIGNGSIGSSLSVPVLTGPGPGWAAIATGTRHSCAINAGSLYCWGLADKLGNGNVAGNVLVPQAVLGLDTDVTDVSVGYDHSCALQNGALYCWGANTHGEVGDGTTLPRYVPYQVFPSGVIAVSAGHQTTCALTRAGMVFCWGRNTSGQVGLDTGGGDVLLPHSLPTTSFGGRPSAVSVGTSHACALTNGTVKCWGMNAFGQLGRDTHAPMSSVPVTPDPWK